MRRAMRFRMLVSRDGNGPTPRPGAAAAVALALAVAGCSADYVEQSQASVLLMVEAVNGGRADVRGRARTTDHRELPGRGTVASGRRTRTR
jgi:hypothetical protein